MCLTQSKINTMIVGLGYSSLLSAVGYLDVSLDNLSLLQRKGNKCIYIANCETGYLMLDNTHPVWKVYAFN